MYAAQHTYTTTCDGLHEGPCPTPPVTQRHLISTPRPVSWVDRLSDAELDRLAAKIERRLRERQRARGGV